VDLVYVVGSSSMWAHNELRYSLRSVARNMPHDRVIISGHLPKWCRGVEHVHGLDRSTDRVKNAQTKLLAALESGKVGDRFALMNDDFYILQPWSCDAIRYVGSLAGRHRNLLAERKPGDPYLRAIGATLQACRDMGWSNPLNCSTHHPVIMQRDKAIETVRFSLSLPVHLELGSIYVAMHGADVIKSPNSKLQKWKGIPTSPVFSSSPSVEQNAKFRKWIASEFPERCPYEKATSGH
jgi:hypothetical protein